MIELSASTFTGSTSGSTGATSGSTQQAYISGSTAYFYLNELDTAKSCGLYNYIITVSNTNTGVYKVIDEGIFTLKPNILYQKINQIF
jgi:hypothetical protein